MQYEIDLDQLYTFLDLLGEDLEILRGLSTETDQIEATELRGVIVSAGELLGYWTAYDSELARRLHISPKLLNNFVRHYKPVSVKEAKVLVSKLISYLKSIEGEIAANEVDDVPDETLEIAEANLVEADSLTQSSLSPNISATEWVALPKSDVVKKSIAAVSVLLDSLVTLATSSNLPDAERALSPIERAELIAILETAIQILKAPLVEKGLLSKLKSGLGDVVSKTASKKTEQALGQAADEALKALTDILTKLPWS